MERASDICFLCGSQTRELLLEKDPWEVYRCLSCGLGVLDPRPSPEEMSRHYEKEYFFERYDQGLDPDSPQFKKRLSGEKHRVRFMRAAKRSGRLLDIGCGYGYFLFACRKEGFEVQGLDVSEWARQYAEQKLGLSVKIGEIGEADWPPGSFDIITMWHSLEHTRHPGLAVSKAAHWLKRNGILVVDVPNYEGTDARFLWEEWDGWQLPYHLWHFTPSSLKRLLDISGLEVVKMKNYHSEVIKKKLHSFFMLRPVARCIAKLYSGTSVAVTARKRVNSVWNNSDVTRGPLHRNAF
ncbi:MAG: class I SAM-dependent methyltransferase [Pseudomonadota bacterium]